MTWRVFAVALTLGMTGACGQEVDPPDRQIRVDRAVKTFSASSFDTIQWPSEDERVQVGNFVYSERCTRCHGPLGMGGTAYARSRGLEVPSLVEEFWPLASVDSLRRVIWVGHAEGMPIFAEGAVPPRDIDAVAGYILLTLRPEVLGVSP